MSSINSGNFTQITPRAAQAIADTVRMVRNLPTDSRATPNRFNTVGGSGLLWGTLTAAWMPGGNTVTLQPCKGPLDSTPLKDAAGHNVPTISSYVSIPLSRNAQCLGAAVNDILAYVAIGSSGTSTLFVLWQPPLIPWFGGGDTQYFGIYNNSATGGSPSLVADTIRARP